MPVLTRSPDILVVHVGGNDMALQASRDIIWDIKTDILHLWLTCPGLLVVWSDIVARKVWCQDRSVDRMNRARAKEVGRFVTRNGGVMVRHRDFEDGSSEFLQGYGNHLNAIGIDLCCLNLATAPESHLVGCMCFLHQMQSVSLCSPW